MLRLAALGIGLFCTQVARVGAAPVFRAPRSFVAGCLSFPSDAAPIDVDRDGKMDLAVACVDSGVVILQGDGLGRLQKTQQIQVPGQPKSIVVADFNKDGAADVACSLLSADQVSVLLNDGSGRFGAPAQYPVGHLPSVLRAGDIDGDDAIDLVTSGSGSNALSILHGDGTGLFGIASTIPTGAAAPVAHVLADLDEDGDRDIATTRVSNDILILLNDGLGNFVQAGTIASGTAPALRVAADLNSDGHLDLAGVSTANVVVFFGNGEGQLSLPVITPIGAYPVDRMFAADLNADGRTDLAVAQQDRVTTLLQSTTGELQSGQIIHGYSSYFLTGADFDMDDQMDLVSSSFEYLTVYLAEAPGFVLDAPYIATGRPKSVVSADFNGDGHLDVVVSNSSTDMLTIMLGTGAGDFVPSAPLIVPYIGPPGGTSSPTAVAARDFNEDGRPDLAVTVGFGGFTQVYLGNGRGGFTLRQQLLGMPPRIADFNEDGHLDLALGCTIGGGFGTCLSAGNGLGNFGSPQPYIQGFFPGAAADLNGDSHLDLVNSFSRPTDPEFANDFIYVLLGNGQGTYTRVVGDYEVGDHPRADEVAIGDVDEDGHVDIVVASSGSNSAQPKLISLLFGDGLGAFTLINMESGRSLVGSLALVDLDLDGDLELAGANGSDPIIFKLDGPRSFGLVERYSCGTVSGAMIVGDFDEDGRPDLLAAANDTNGVCYVANRTPLLSVTRACADGLDNDGDSSIDFPADPGCSDPWDGQETDSLSITFADGRLQWNRWRPDLRFDVVRGSLLSLKVSRGDFSIATLACAVDDAEAPYLIDATLPTTGEGFWFLVRPETSAGIGSYDSHEPGQQGLRDAEINSSALACP
jgi:hypothetical protein